MNRPLGGGYREGVIREGGIGGGKTSKKIEKSCFRLNLTKLALI